MNLESDSNQNVKQAIPFFGVTDMAESVRFYVVGLGFKIIHRWEVDGALRWCWMELGGAAIMLQTFFKEGQGPWRPEGKLGQGVTISFQCHDALAIYNEATHRGLNPSRPFVGNGMWVTTLFDPDGYQLEFESPTDQPEETEYIDPV